MWKVEKVQNKNATAELLRERLMTQQRINQNETEQCQLPFFRIYWLRSYLLL